MRRQYEIHEKLVEACASGDVYTICRAIYKHYMNSINYFLKQEGLPEDSFASLYEKMK